MANKKKKVTTTVTTTVTEEITNVPTNEKTQIVCILDRSGSMSSIMSDSIGGFNTFLKQQKELKDEATLTVALFDDKYELLYDNVDIKKAEELTNKVWFPRGTTALYDAIGKTINAVKAEHARLGNEAPSKVLVCIITDGMENASKEYGVDNVRRMIKECENNDWNFMYLAANQDAFSVGSSFGVSRGNTINYVANAGGVKKMSDVLYNATTSYRSMSSDSVGFASFSKNLIDDDSDDVKNNSNASGNANDVVFTTGTLSTNLGEVNNATVDVNKEK